MNLVYNCTHHGRVCFSIEEIQSKFDDFPCNSSDKGVGLSSVFYDCPFYGVTFKQIVKIIAYHMLKCAPEIVNFTSANGGYNTKVEFFNSSIGMDGLKDIVISSNVLSNIFSRLSSNGVNIIISFYNSLVLKETAEQWLESCDNIRVLYHPKGFLNKIVKSVEHWSGPLITDLYDSNRFYTIVSSQGVNNSECIFNQIIDNTSESSSLSSIPLAQANIVSSNLSVLIGVVIATSLGLSYFGKYLYNKYFTTNDEHHLDELTTDADYLGVSLDETPFNL